MQYPDIDFIVYPNRRTIKENGGLFVPPHNFLHGEQLEYISEAVQAEMFGEELYPLLTDKAAVYMYNIISNHVFADGNKRTGLIAALAFIHQNGHRLANQLVDLNGVVHPEGKKKGLENFTLT